MTAGVQKISSQSKIGFRAHAEGLTEGGPHYDEALQLATATGNAAAIKDAEKEALGNRVKRFDDNLDATIAGIFIVLVAAVGLLSIREWILLLARRKLTVSKPTRLAAGLRRGRRQSGQCRRLAGAWGGAA